MCFIKSFKVCFSVILKSKLNLNKMKIQLPILLLSALLNINLIGQFSAEKIITNLPDEPLAFDAGDYDGDGDIDFVVTSRNGNEIRIYVNDGSQNFNTSHLIDGSFSFGVDVKFGDLDQDGDLDILVGALNGGQDGIFWYRNNGAGVYGTRITIISSSLDPDASQVEIVDYDNDGLLDIIGVSTLSDFVYFHKNLGSGNFANKEWIHTFSSDGSVNKIIAADVDNDGRTEIVFGNEYYNSSFSFYEKRILSYEYNTGVTQQHVIYSTTSTSVYFYDACVDLDLDGNSMSDIILQIPSLNTVKVNTNGHNSYSYGALPSLSGVIFDAGDIDMDGVKDVISLSGGTSLNWNKSTGSNAFVTPTTLVASTTAWDDAMLVDIDLDGDLDIAALHLSSDKIVWFENLTINCTTTTFSYNDTICQGSNYTFNGQNLTTTGIYKDTLVNSGGCDSIITLNLEVLNSVLPSVSITSNKGLSFCNEGQVTFLSTVTNGGSAPTYQWKKNGNDVGSGLSSYSPNVSTLNTGDIISCVLSSSALCSSPSQVTSNSLSLTINNLTSYSYYDTVCQGSSYSFNGQSLSATGIYKDTLVNTGGCDSIVTLNLVVKSCVNPIQDSCSGLIISEYIEGSSYNKAIEIYNASSSSIDLAQYKIKVYINGSSTATSISLSGILSSYDTYIISHTSANATILGMANITSGNLSFNGDDAVSLERNDTLIDLIGIIGDLPSSGQWGSGTKDYTLVRKSTIKGGVNTNPISFDPSIQWDIYNTDVTSYLGTHQGSCSNTTGGYQLQLSQNKLVIYPNPTNGILKIENIKDNEVADLFNSAGILIKSYDGNIEQIDLSYLSNGFYYLKIKGYEPVKIVLKK